MSGVRGLATGSRIWLATSFALAMGFLEAAVVVYLRLLYYPRGFDFPLVPLPPSVAAVEVGREAATLVMLAAVGGLAGRTKWERFGWLCFLFGVWDLAFYAGLKGTLGWPASLLTWDILFLIPVIWVGPVLAPVMTSAALIAGGLALIRLAERGESIRVRLADWALIAVALALQLHAYTANAARVAAGQIPQRFPWPGFLLGVLLGLATLLKVVWGNRREGASPR